jgi:hypothetical protein
MRNDFRYVAPILSQLQIEKEKNDARISLSKWWTANINITKEIDRFLFCTKTNEDH